MTLIQAMTVVGQIGFGKASTRPCEYFDVVGCVLAPLGELRAAVQYLILWPLTISGGGTAGCNGESLNMLFNCVCTVTSECEWW